MKDTPVIKRTEGGGESMTQFLNSVKNLFITMNLGTFLICHHIRSEGL